MREDRFAFDSVERQADLGGRILVVIEKADERGDSAFEVDVVFPEGIVCVDEQRLASRESGHVNYGIRFIPTTSKRDLNVTRVSMKTHTFFTVSVQCGDMQPQSC